MHFQLRIGGFALLFFALTFTALSQSKVHTVKRGETLYSLSRKYDTTVDKLLRLNPKISAQSMPVGYALKVPGAPPPPTPASSPNPSNASADRGTAGQQSPPPSTTDRNIPTKLRKINYRVKQGETFNSIGQRFAISQQRLRELNPDIGGKLKTGEVVVLEMLMFDEDAARKKKEKAIAKKKAAEKERRVKSTPKIEDPVAEEEENSSVASANNGTAGSSAQPSNMEDEEIEPIDDEELDIYSNPIYRPAPAGYERILIVHGIKSGESLEDIAGQYEATKGQLLAWNKEKAQEPLVVGETLIVKIEDVPIVKGQGELPDEITTVRGEDGKSVLADGRVVEDGVDNIMKDSEGDGSSQNTSSSSSGNQTKTKEKKEDTAKKEQKPEKEEKSEKEEKTEKDDDGPNISRARAGDVIHTGKGLDEEGEDEAAEAEPKKEEPASKEEEEEEEGEEEEEKKKDDGPNISRARVSDVVHTGKGMEEEKKQQAAKEKKTVEETLRENVRRRERAGSQEMTGLPESHAGSVEGTGREPDQPSPYGQYIAWYDEARVGSYIKVTNPNSGESVFAKVIGKVKDKSVAVECAPKVCQQLGIPLGQAVPLIVEYND